MQAPPPPLLQASSRGQLELYSYVCIRYGRGVMDSCSGFDQVLKGGHLNHPLGNE